MNMIVKEKKTSTLFDSDLRFSTNYRHIYKSEIFICHDEPNIRFD